MKKGFFAAALVAFLVSACHTSYQKARADSDVHLQLAREYYEAGNVDKALSEIESSLNAYSKNADAGLFKAEIFAKAGKYDLAEKTAEEASRDLPEAERYKKDFWQGIFLLQKGDCAGAIGPLEKSVAASPKFIEGYSQLGMAYAKSGAPDKAAEAYSRWTEIDPKSEAAWSQLGVAATASRQFDRARKALEKAVEINPKSAITYNYLGSLAEEQNNLDEAEKYFARSIALDEKIPYSHLNMGQLLMLRNKTKEAYPFLLKALVMLPGNKFAMYWIGKYHARLNEPAPAYESFEKALAADPLFWPASAAMAETYLATGAEFSRVEKQLLEGITKDPQNRKGHYYYLARIYLKNKNPDAALASADKAGALLEKTDQLAAADFHLLRGDILAEMNRRADAKKEFHLAASAPPGSDIAQQAKKRLGK